jgi:hypothetical protein
MSGILEIEKAREELIVRINQPCSQRKKLFLICGFIKTILNYKDELIKQAYLLEFIDIYIKLLSNYNPFYLNPEKTEKIIEQVEELRNQSFLSEQVGELEEAVKRIKEKLERLKKILAGNEEKEGSDKLLFPVLEVRDEESKDINLGALDSITVEVSKAQGADKFIIIPSEAEIEERIKSQIENSWIVAINYVKKLVRKTYKNHKVIIQFDKRIGYYIGESLGVTLAIGFIEKLLAYYNSSYLVKIKNRIAMTGGMEKDGRIVRTGEEIIKRKIEIAFYSDVNTLVIPHPEEAAAEEKLSEINKKYPKRNLKLTIVKDLIDIINRRNIIEIKKQNPVIRTLKNLKKHYGVSILTLILVLVISYFYFINIDNNPAFLENEGNIVLVKNKSGKVLWSKRLDSDLQKESNLGRMFQRLIDINDDGINEVLLTHEDLRYSKENAEIGRIVCYNNFGNVIWKYLFKDTIKCVKESHTADYYIGLIDWYYENGKKVLLLSASNRPYYPGALFKLNLLKGSRLYGTLWNSGHYKAGYIKDLNKDGKLELIGGGENNSFKQQIIYSIDLQNLNGRGPAINGYEIVGKELAKFNCYILIPNSDYSTYNKLPNSRLDKTSPFIDERAKKMYFNLFEDEENSVGMQYRLDFNLKDVEAIIPSLYTARRDFLVNKGLLKKPYTNTFEYGKLLESQFRFWNGNKFVRREELR